MSDNHPLTTGTDLSPAPFADTVEPRLAVVGTDFLTFGVGGGANVEAQEDYQNDPQRPTGNLPGLARSNFNNKAIRQGTFVAHSLCLWISQQLTLYIPDDGNDIAWIGEFSSALAQFVLALIPPGPNLGAYLPLAGGNMSGNITFSPGITTILSNNTWHYARDTSGTARGLIIKGSDNNIYINDGTCPYVMFNGSPILNNNTWYGARSTTGSLHGVVGILSDNATHVASGPSGDVFLDCTSGGSIWANSNVVVPNNRYFYGKTTAGTPCDIIGISNGNELRIGGGHGWVTSIFAGGGQYIYMRATTNFINQIIVNQYSYLNGGGRAYIPGGNDPWQIYADQGFYSRTHFIVGNTRDWTAGCLRGGTFGIADESVAAMRFEIDLNGHVHCYNNLYAADCSFGGVTTTAFHATSWGQIDGGLTVYNSLNVSSGNLSASGTGYIYNGLNVYNSMTVQSGQLTVYAPIYVTGGATIFNNLNVASGTIWLNGPVNMYSNAYIAGGLQIGGLSWLVDGGGNWLTSGGNLNFYGWVQGGYLVSTGGGQVAGDWRVGQTVWANYLYSYSHIHAEGNCYANGFTSGYYGFECASNIWLKGALNGWPNQLQWTGAGGRGYSVSALADWLYFGWNDNAQPPSVQQWMFVVNAGGIQLLAGNSYKPGGGSWVDSNSQRQFKKDISAYERGLEAVVRLQPRNYRFNGLDPTTAGDENLHVGFIVDEVEDIMPEMVCDYDRGCVHGVVRTIDTTPLIFAMLNSIKTLTARIEALEGR